MNDEPLPSVAGRMQITFAQFELRCQHLIQEEQAKAFPDNALIGVLCDAVRLKREYLEQIQIDLEKLK
jgi:hypothetical protein